jgi:cyclic pyranopterin phosphate synthase
MNCIYCHREGSHAENELAFGDVMKVIERTIPYGIKSIRLTGGEPLTHRDIVKICREIKLRFPDVNLGINTNAILINTLLKIIGERHIDSVVVGIDYYDGLISKEATTGRSSKEILENVLKIKDAGCSVNISTVYNGDIKNIEHIVEWCFQHGIFIKILEVVTDEVTDYPSADYQIMANHLVDKYNLDVRFNQTKNQYYAVSASSNAVYFFHSHCRLRECDICARLHLRVSCEGNALSCLHPKTPQFSLLDGKNYTTNMHAGLHYLGTPPENAPKLPDDF